LIETYNLYKFSNSKDRQCYHKIAIISASPIGSIIHVNNEQRTQIKPTSTTVYAHRSFACWLCNNNLVILIQYDKIFDILNDKIVSRKN